MNRAVLEADEAGFERLLEYIRTSRGFDFTGYKRSTLRRRITKRMNDLGIEDYGAYLDELEVSAGEFNTLFNTILINVSSFFRDPSVWDHVAETIIPEIVTRGRDGDSIRIWSAGCATGEEPYTIAILLAEHMGLRNYAERVKIFATDVDEDALAQARHGVYPAGQLKDMPEALVARYFDAANEGYTLAKDVRRAVIFGRNDLVRDAPISRLDLITCRNTLMYFNGDTQRNVMARLHMALIDTGLLVLGKSELLLSYNEGFTPENLGLRVFRKVPGVRLRYGALLAAPGRAPAVLPTALLEAFSVSPIAQLVLDTDGNVAFSNRPLRNLFGIDDREFGTPLKDLELSYRPVELRSLIDQAATQKEPVRSARVTWTPREGSERQLEVEVSALRHDGRHTGTSIAFIDVTRYASVTSQLERSKHELETAYEELQSTVEELETTNEELQSTNEELETMNEELQSSNEELQTMNEELRLRTEELNRVNILVDSMLASLGMAVAVVDSELRVTMWNDQAKDTWGVGLADVRDRHFLNLDIGLPVDELREPLRACVTGASKGVERELRARDRRGVDIRCHVRCYPLADSGGALAGAIVLMQISPPAGAS